MPNLNWNDLNRLQLGRYAEYYAKMELASYGLYIYAPEVDDHGVDFIFENSKHEFWEVQVKSIREFSKSRYVYIPKTKMDITNDKFIICFLYFENGNFPSVYLIPATAWGSKNRNSALADRDYKECQKSKPEWWIYCSKTRLPELENFKFDRYIGRIK